MMQSWRAAILAKDSEAVLALDRAFRERPEVYAGALADSAQEDADDRVRAFSTRVLGKLKDSRWAGVFEQLLGDKSSFVRENAAWALGELAAAGRPPSAKASRALEEASAGDPASNVRAAAALAQGRGGR
jgi:HEAT repeat protein